MTITPGPFAPLVTQWVAGTPTLDVYGNEVAAFTGRPIRVLAAFPGGGGTGQASSKEDQNTVTADYVLLLDPASPVSALDEWTLPTDGKRYRTQGEPGRYQNPWTGTAVTQVHLRRIS